MAEEYTVNFNLLQDATRTAAGQGASPDIRNDRIQDRKDNAAARKSFRARHKCDTATDKTSARYWSCKMW